MTHLKSINQEVISFCSNWKYPKRAPSTEDLRLKLEKGIRDIGNIRTSVPAEFSPLIIGIWNKLKNLREGLDLSHYNTSDELLQYWLKRLNEISADATVIRVKIAEQAA